MTRIAQALTKLFEKHRIVFWYDSKQELRADFEALTLEEIEKIELNNNEFGVKYRILRQQPQQKFLLYHEGSPPDDLNNWLLDVQLAHGEFRTDQIALWLAEIDLGLEFSEVVENYTPFFQAQERKESLKRMLKSDDTLTMIKLKMLAVCTKSDPRLDAIVETLLAELADNREDKINLVSRCHLHNFFWEQIERLYGYQSQDPRIKDFALELFKSCYAMGTEWGTEWQFSLMNEALIFLKRWKDSIRCKNSFETLWHQCAEDLDIEGNLIKRDFREVIDIDYFYVIDQKIIR